MTETCVYKEDLECGGLGEACCDMSKDISGVYLVAYRIASFVVINLVHCCPISFDQILSNLLFSVY